MKKFTENDIFINTIRAHPRVSFFCYNGKVYIDNSSDQQVKLNDFLRLPSGVVVSLDNSLLTEDGNFLITESGDYILIE